MDETQTEDNNSLGFVKPAFEHTYVLYKNGSDYTPKQVPVRIREPKFRSGPCAICGQKNVKSGRERGVYLCFRCEVGVELVKRGVEAS